MKTITMLMLLLSALPSWAGEVKLEAAQVQTSVAAVERGAEQLMGSCHSCHALKYVTYRDLLNYGMDKQKVDGWRGDTSLDTSLTSLLPDDAAMQSFGKIPPDLSLMAKAREGGVDYVYTYLLAYAKDKDGVLSNHVFPETKMPDALQISEAADAAQRSEIQAKARDITSFLNWAADPHGEERRHLGYYVLGYLLVLTVLLYFVKNRVWARLK